MHADLGSAAQKLRHINFHVCPQRSLCEEKT